MQFETLAHGFGLIEAPRVDGEDNLYFSDVTNGGVYRRTPDGEITTIVPKRRGVGGIALHRDGGLVISGRDICHVRDGETRILFVDPAIPGFNDLFTDELGRVYFGSLRSNPFSAEEPRTPGELYRIDLDSTCHRLYGEVGLSNGIGFSPDGRWLYHCDTAAGQILRHAVNGEEVGDRSVFATLTVGRPDGLAVDEEGGVWVASYGGACVLRYLANGRLHLQVPVPATAVTSLCFGGADGRDLYVVSADNTEEAGRDGTLFRTRSEVAGLATPMARV